MEELKQRREQQLQRERVAREKHEQVEAKQKQEEEFLLKEKTYNNLNEEVKDARKIIEKLRYKYKAATMEIGDLQKEHE
jgi:hypothetical protein